MTDTLTDRARVRRAFTNLRRRGYTARMNFKCCQSCAWAQLEQDLNLDTDDAWNSVKVVFFHGQDDEAFRHDGSLERDLHVRWSGDRLDIACALVDQFGLDRVVVPDDGTATFRVKAVER